MCILWLHHSSIHHYFGHFCRECFHAREQKERRATTRFGSFHFWIIFLFFWLCYTRTRFDRHQNNESDAQFDIFQHPLCFHLCWILLLFSFVVVIIITITSARAVDQKNNDFFFILECTKKHSLQFFPFVFILWNKKIEKNSFLAKLNEFGLSFTSFEEKERLVKSKITKKK